MAVFQVPRFPSPTMEQAGANQSTYRYLAATANSLDVLAGLVQQVGTQLAGAHIPTFAEIRNALRSTGAYALPLDGLVGAAGSAQPAIVFATATSQPPASLYAAGTIMIQASGGGYDWFVRFALAPAKWTKVNPPAAAHMVTDNTVQNIGPGAGKTFADLVTLSPSAGTVALAVTAGQVNSASQFGASVYASVAQSINSGVLTALAFNTELYDRGACHDPAVNNSRITVPVGGAGVWRFSGFAEFASSATGSRVVTLRGNGGLVLAKTCVGANATAAATTNIPVDSDEYVVADGDYVELMAQQDSGGALNVNAGLGTTRLTGFKIC